MGSSSLRPGQLDLGHEIRDPVVGLVRLTDLEMRVIDTPVFQRLRRIKQLALADVVYPGCVHNRFLHSIGTMAMADAIWTRLESRGDIPDALREERQAVRLAALLHDVGHGPFSHLAEYLLNRFSDRAEVRQTGSGEKRQMHEAITADIVRADPSLTAILGSDLQARVCQLLDPSPERRFQRDIVSSGLDADKLDYLLRDAYFAGVEYGRFDVAKVLDSCRVVPGSEAETLLGIHEDGRFAVEQMILAKWHMNQQVYGHRVRRVTDAMVVRGLELAVLDEHPRIAPLFKYKRAPSFLREYTNNDDDTVMAIMLEDEKTTAAPRHIFQKLHDRHLFKEAYSVPIQERGVPDARVRTWLLGLLGNEEQARQRRAAVERRVAEIVGCEAWEVIVLAESAPNPAYGGLGVLNPEEIYVVSDYDKPRYLSEHPDLIAFGSNVRAEDVRGARSVYVIANEDKLDRDARDAIRPRIYETLVESAGVRG